eukprot:s5186_g2.t1
MTYKKACNAVDFIALYGDVAVMESLAEKRHAENQALRRDVNDLKDHTRRLQAGHNQLEAQDEMLSDMLGGVHDGVVMLGGYTNHSDLTPGQRQRMFNVERSRDLEERAQLTLLMREAFADAELIQRCILLILDAMNGGQPLEREARINLFQSIARRLEHISNRQRSAGEIVVADRFQPYSGQRREMAYID